MEKQKYIFCIMEKYANMNKKGGYAMRKAKRILIMLMVSILLICAGCGKSKEAPTTQATEPQQTVSTTWLFPDGTQIVGVNVGGMDVDQAYQAVSTGVSAYTLEATVNNRTVEISAEQVKLSVSEQSVREFARNLEDGKKTDGPAAEFDIELLKSYIADQCQTAAVNASVRYNASADTFEVTKERDGISVDVQAVVEQITPVLQTLGGKCQITVDEQVLKPTVFRDDARLQSGATAANGYLQVSLTYVYAPDQVEASSQKLTKDEIGKMVGFNKDYVPYINASAVNSYASSMNQKYAVRAKFKTTGGGYISINTSNISQAVDTAALAADLKSCLEQRISGTRNAPYKSAAGAAMVWNGNYVEVDLTRQHLWVYKNGNCVASTPIVSGCVASNAETPTGVYSITYKTTNVTLRGPTWNDWVAYWMPFLGNYGLHDASWRTEFGGDIYLYEGSHGCVNIPPSAAGQVYSNISSGTKVILYGGVTDVKLEERKFSGTLEYNVVPEAEPFKLDVSSQDAPILTYASDAPTVAQVAEDGTVTVKGVGTANITVSAPAHGRHGAGTTTVKITVAYDCSAGHTLTWTTTKEPGCVSGSQTGVCKCGHSQTRPLDPVKDHTYVNWTISKQPTCVAGEETGTCSGCGASQKRPVAAVQEHTYGPWQTEVAPGCEQAGKQSCKCSVCGEVKTQELSGTGHSFTEEDAYCTNGCGTAKPVDTQSDNT